MPKVTQLVGGEAETQTQKCWSQSSFHAQLQPCLQLKPQRKTAGAGAGGLKVSVQVLSSQNYCSHPKTNPVTPDLLSYFFQYKPIQWHLFPGAIACFLRILQGKACILLVCFTASHRVETPSRQECWVGGWIDGVTKMKSNT